MRPCRCAQKTEIKFDLESPVVELARQIRMEFDFLHEARVMDAVGRNLQVPHPQGMPRQGVCVVR